MDAFRKHSNTNLNVRKKKVKKSKNKNILEEKSSNKKQGKTNKEDNILNQNHTNLKSQKRTISFSEDTKTSTSGKVQRQATPYKEKLKKLKLQKTQLDFDTSDETPVSKNLMECTFCDDEGTTDTSFVSFQANASTLIPSLSELTINKRDIENQPVKKKRTKNIDKKRKCSKNILDGSWISFSEESVNNPEEYNKSVQKQRKKKKQKHKVQKVKLLAENQRNENKEQSTQNKVVDISSDFDVAEVYFDGNFSDVLNDSDKNEKGHSFKEVSFIKPPDIAHEIRDVDIDIWENAKKSDILSNNFNETYAEFCSVLENSSGNVSLDNSVFASDVFSQSNSGTTFSYRTNSSWVVTEDSLEKKAVTNVSEIESCNVSEEQKNENEFSDTSKKENENEEINTDDVCSLKTQVLNGVNLPYETENDSNVQKGFDAQTTTVKYYYFENSVIIVLKPYSKLYFHGLLSVTVVHGTVEVFGYKLNSNSKPAKIYSPHGTGFLYFETFDSNNIDSDINLQLSTLFSTISIDDSLKAELINCQSDDTVLYCEKLCDRGLSFIEKHIDQVLFPKPKGNSLRCIFQERANNWNVFEPNYEWPYLIDTISETDRALICGGKSVGKSTMLRYCVNRLLSKHKQILVIDLDPGQPEFTISGCVSAIVVDEPIFGPNYTHIRKTEKSFFVANIDVSRDLEQYLSAVKDIVNFCNSLDPMVTLVNYMGYSKGIGVSLVAAVVAILSPTVLVQLESKYVQRNFDAKLKPSFIERHVKLFVPNIEDPLDYRHMTINSTVENKGSELPPRQIREMCVLMYFGQVLPEDIDGITDSRVPVYEVNLPSVKLICGNRTVPPMVMNGNLVALCHKEEGYVNYCCVGWGIVRGIDLTTDKLYLITSMNEEDLEQVDHIVLGSVFLPQFIYLTTDSSCGLIPYVSQGVLSIFGEIPKRIQDYVRRKIN